jgi:hypothetical protein
MGLVGCPETSVTNYQSTLRKIPDDRRSHLTLRRKPEATHNVCITSVIVIEFWLLGIQLSFEYFQSIKRMDCSFVACSRSFGNRLSACPYAGVYQHHCNWTDLSCILILRAFMEICPENPNLVKVGQKCQARLALAVRPRYVAHCWERRVAQQ